MTPFSAIDLEKLPASDIVETLDFEDILAEMLTDLRERRPELTIDLESDPIYGILEVAAYREMHTRARINDASRAVMLAYAQKNDLDNLAAFFSVERQVVSPGDPDATPPVDPVLELDTRLRSRTQLSLEGHSTAGPVGSYIFHALAADPLVKDVDVDSPRPAEVVVTVLSSEGEGLPSDALLATVEAHLNAEDVRPLTDLVTVQAPTILRYSVIAELFLFVGPDSEVVRVAAEKAVRDYVEARHRLGHDITLSGLYAALHQPGVQRVVLADPIEDLIVQSNQAAWPENILVIVSGRDE